MALCAGIGGLDAYAQGVADERARIEAIIQAYHDDAWNQKRHGDADGSEDAAMRICKRFLACIRDKGQKA